MQVELSVQPLIAVIRKENLGAPHPLLAGGEQYVSPRFTGDAERALRAELAAAGLSDRARLTDFTGMLSTIQQSTTEFYGWVTATDDAYSVLVAAHGRTAFAMTRRGDRVQFERVGAGRLAEALVERLPNVPPARAESISVREAEATRSGPRPVLRRPTDAAAARRLDALLRTPRRRVAKLYAARRDDAGNRTRSREWLDLIDLPEGRWAVHATAGRGERTINAVAATPAHVAATLTALLRTAT